MENGSLRAARFAFFDVETTGFNPAVCGVVEVACQIVEDGRVVWSFESLVDPGRAIPWVVRRIHGITDGDVFGKPTLRELRPTLAGYAAGSIVVAHNLAFDRQFLPFLDRYPGICSWRLAASVVPEAPNHKNQTLGAFFSVCDPELRGRRPHRALADVIVTRHVFGRCLERYLAAGHPDRLDALLAFLDGHGSLARHAYEAKVVPRV